MRDWTLSACLGVLAFASTSFAQTCPAVQERFVVLTWGGGAPHIPMGEDPQSKPFVSHLENEVKQVAESYGRRLKDQGFTVLGYQLLVHHTSTQDVTKTVKVFKPHLKWVHLFGGNLRANKRRSCSDAFGEHVTASVDIPLPAFVGTKEKKVGTETVTYYAAKIRFTKDEPQPAPSPSPSPAPKPSPTPEFGRIEEDSKSFEKVRPRSENSGKKVHRSNRPHSNPTRSSGTKKSYKLYDARGSLVGEYTSREAAQADAKAKRIGLKN